MQKTAGVYVVLLVSNELFAAPVRTFLWNKNEVSLPLYDGTVLYLLLCVSIKSYLSFLYQVFVFSCILFTVCVLHNSVF